MRIIGQLAFVFVVCWACEAICALLPFAFPAGVLSMVVVFLLLCFGVVKQEQLSSLSSFLTGTMALYFIPAGVDILESYPLIRNQLLPIALVILLTTLITFAVTAGATALCMRFLPRKGDQA